MDCEWAYELEMGMISMDKIPFCFPVFYHGLIAGHTLYSQPEVVNLFLSGNARKEPKVWPEVDRITANKYIAGLEAVPAYRCEEMIKETNEPLKRVQQLGIQGIKAVISAFHVFLKERTLASKEIIYSLETSIRESEDPYQYYVVALRESLLFTKRSKEYITKAVKKELHNLCLNSDIPDLFQFQKEDFMRGNATLAVVNTAVPMVVQGVMTILFAEQNSSSVAMEQIQSGNFSSAIKALASEGKLTAYDYYKWNNILKIAQKANDELREDAVMATSEFDFDWFLRFFEAAGNIRAEDMQHLWAKVLAGEIKQPGCFSLRTVEALRNMTAREALAFKNASELVLQESDGTFFLFCDTDLSDATINQKYGLTMDAILTLEGIGLISALRVDNEIEVSDEGADGFFNGSDLMILFESSNEQFNTFRYRSYHLSAVGKQLLPIVQEESNNDYLIDLGKILRNDLQEKVDVCVYRVIARNANDLELDFNADLLDAEN